MNRSGRGHNPRPAREKTSIPPCAIRFFLSFPSAAWECVPRSAASPLPPPCPPTPAWKTTKKKNHRHSGIFIPPAHDSGIANWRWRNENVRNPPPTAAPAPPLRRSGIASPTGTIHPRQTFARMALVCSCCRSASEAESIAAKRRHEQKSGHGFGRTSTRRQLVSYGVLLSSKVLHSNFSKRALS